MSERDELIAYLSVCSACHGCGIGADGDTCTNCDDRRQPNRRAADLLERDGEKIADMVRWQEDAVRNCARRQCGRREARIAELEAENARLRETITSLQTVMVAAAEELHEHWAAHCDADGYGPSNLMTRLERGIAAQYLYKAGDFARLHASLADLAADRDAARAALADVSAAIGTNEFMDPPDGGSPSLADQVRRMRAALAEAQRDAARYRTLKSWYYAADFIYPDAGSVLIFQLPTQGTRVSASLDATIDAAQERSHASE